MTSYRLSRVKTESVPYRFRPSNRAGERARRHSLNAVLYQYMARKQEVEDYETEGHRLNSAATSFLMLAV